MSRAYLLKFSCQSKLKHLSYYAASIMATTKWCHRPPDKRIRNSQPTNLLRATACYFHHILIIGTIRNIVGRGGGGRGGLELDSSYGIKSTRTTDVSETNLKCLSTAFVIFFMLIIKVATNKHERVRNKVFLHIYDITDDVILERNIWIISNQQEKVPML